MTKFGEHLMKLEEEGLVHPHSKDVPGVRVHAPPVDVRAVRRRTGLSQAEFAAKFDFSPRAVRN
jgi:DNA-binding transcriptional regulator YiaG